MVVYVVTDIWLDGFRLFLERHAALLRALPAWTLRIVVPPLFPDIVQRSNQVVRNQLLPPLKTAGRIALVLRSGSLAPHTVARRLTWTNGTTGARDAFAAPRFKALYRAWKQDGEPALAGAGSRAISDAVDAGAGRVETLELGHRYGHLSPLAAVSRSH